MSEDDNQIHREKNVTNLLYKEDRIAGVNCRELAPHGRDAVALA
jgi:hypothetical protein